MKKNLIIKLCRFGKKHAPFYRFGVMPVFRHPSKRFALEYLGWYNPFTKEIKVNKERLEHYLSLNIALTDTVSSLLKKHNLKK